MANSLRIEFLRVVGEGTPPIESVDTPETEPTVDELRQKVADYLEKEGFEVDQEDWDFCFTDAETQEPRDFGDAEGNVIGFLYNIGLDGHDVLAELRIIEEQTD